MASGWLFGPIPDLLFGCGLAYAGAFALQRVAGAELRSLVPLGVLPIAALLVVAEARERIARAAALDPANEKVKALLDELGVAR